MPFHLCTGSSTRLSGRSYEYNVSQRDWTATTVPSATVNRTLYTDQPAGLTALSDVGQSDRSITMTNNVAEAVTYHGLLCTRLLTVGLEMFCGHDIFAIS